MAEKSFWDAEKELAFFDKNKREKLKVSKVVFKGEERIDIRTFWMNDADEWCPGKGVLFPADKLDQVIEALQKAKEHSFGDKKGS